MKFLYGFSLEVVDSKNENSPAYLRIRGDWAGSLKKKYYTDEELMEKMHNIYEIGLNQGRKEKSDEMRKILNI